MRSCVFVVRLSKPARSAVSIAYATQEDTAKAGVDFVHSTGRLNFAPGDIVRQIAIPIRGVAHGALDVQFKLKLTAPVGATLANNEVIGVIPGARALAQPVVAINNPVLPSP